MAGSSTIKNDEKELTENREILCQLFLNFWGFLGERRAPESWRLVYPGGRSTAQACGGRR